jgi:hypothetical protein
MVGEGWGTYTLFGESEDTFAGCKEELDSVGDRLAFHVVVVGRGPMGIPWGGTRDVVPGVVDGWR